MSLTQAQVEKILSKLDTLVKLNAATLIEGKTLMEQVKLLAQTGMQRKDIATITGKTPNNIGVMLNYIKKSAKKKKTKKK